MANESLGTATSGFAEQCGNREQHFASRGSIEGKNKAFALASATPEEAARVEGEVTRLFGEKCASCHAEGTSYSNVKFLRKDSDGKAVLLTDVMTSEGLLDTSKPKDSYLMTRIAGASPDMPMDEALSAAQVATVLAWVEDVSASQSAVASTQNISSTLASEEPQFAQNETDVVTCIKKDWEESVASEDQAFVRYFSLAHLKNAGKSDEDIQVVRDGLTKLINSLSLNRQLRKPFPVDPGETIYRIDLRSYAWNASLWEDIARTSPYSKVYDNPRLRLDAKIGTSIPFVRADWFVATASKPPLYYSILLKDSGADVASLESLLGVNKAENIVQSKAARALIGKAGPSTNSVNRVLERHRPKSSSPFGFYYISYDFDNVLVTDPNDLRNAKRFPLGPCLASQGSPCSDESRREARQFKESGGEMIFGLPNGLHGYYIANAEGQRLDSAPLDIVSNTDIRALTENQRFGISPTSPRLEEKLDEVKTVSSGASCMRCHVAGIIVAPNEFDMSNAALAALDIPLSLVNRVRSLYKDTNTLKREFYDRDNRVYRNALDELGLSAQLAPENEPVYKATQLYEAPLSLKELIAEVAYGRG